MRLTLLRTLILPGINVFVALKTGKSCLDYSIL